VGGAPLALAANGATTTPTAPYNPASTPSRQGVGAPVDPCFGTGKQITETVKPTPIFANGTSTSTATAHVSELIGGVQTPCPSQSVTFSSSDPKEKVSAVTNHLNGNYSVVITSSKRVGTATITATLHPIIFPLKTATAVLRQVAGPATKITLSVSPASIPGNGTSTSTGTATVKDASGRAIVGNTVKFSSSDPGEKFGAVSGHANGTYTVTITSSTKAETATITATDTSVSPSIAATAPLTQTAVAAIAVPATGSTVTSPATVGFGLMALGLGLLTRARRLRGRGSRSRRVEE
jgi:adhesin/invasin